MKKLTFLLLSAFLALALVGCGTSSKEDKAIHEDLLNYANVELPKIAELEAELTSSYESVSGENYTDDPTMLNALGNQIIPLSSELIEKAEKIVPATKEVDDVHDIYLSAIKNQDSAFTILVSAIQKQDLDKIDQANEKLLLARQETEEYIEEIEKLAAENNITFDRQ